MRTVVIAATEPEIRECRTTAHGCDFVVSGMGATNTAIATVTAIERYRPELIIQIGIAGAMDRSIEIGDALFVESDYQADLGAWRGEQFVHFDTPMITVQNPTTLRGVRAQSVNAACTRGFGCSSNNGYLAQIESMEGAAFFQAASAYNSLQFIQIRSVSNYTDSLRSQWKISEAISVLADTLNNLLPTYR